MADKFSASDFLKNDLVEKANNANERLRQHLTARIGISIDPKTRYLFDWKSDEPSCSQEKDTKADCEISISPEHLEEIAGGDLNPQVALLSEKISVSGKHGLAIYFFNLISPR